MLLCVELINLETALYLPYNITGSLKNLDFLHDNK